MKKPIVLIIAVIACGVLSLMIGHLISVEVQALATMPMAIIIGLITGKLMSRMSE